MFGAPPYVVDMTLDLSPPATVSVEFAHEEMPYTSLHFLRQVDRGLWDGTQIARNAGHVIQAGPGARRQGEE